MITHEKAFALVEFCLDHLQGKTSYLLDWIDEDAEWNDDWDNEIDEIFEKTYPNVPWKELDISIGNWKGIYIELSAYMSEKNSGYLLSNVFGANRTDAVKQSIIAELQEIVDDGLDNFKNKFPLLWQGSRSRN